MRNECTAPGCVGKHHARGLCSKHYQVAERAGTLPARLTLEDRSRKYSRLNAETGCIEWIGSKSKFGYGRVRVGENILSAHRAAWESVNGEIPDGLCVLHKCDNPPCINVDHLFLGTQADNVADMNAKGRQAVNKGEGNPRAKLTDEHIKRIRQDVRLRSEIAIDYGISRVYVGSIQREDVWRHIN